MHLEPKKCLIIVGQKAQEIKDALNAISGTATNERIITSQPRYGEKIKVETPTTLMGSLEFQNAAKVQFFYQKVTAAFPGLFLFLLPTQNGSTP